MEEPVLVYTGEVKAGGKGTVLKSSPIGSCVVAVLFDGINKAGAMAHIMLPGKAPGKSKTIRTRYAADAIEELINQARMLNLNTSTLKAIIAGGGNVLKRENDSIGADNVKSTTGLLKTKQVEILKKSVGGTKRRTVRFDVDTGKIYCSEGDSPEKLLLQIFPNHQFLKPQRK